MVYQWKPTARISKVDPQKAGELMRELADSNSLTAQNLVEISKPENSLLHNVFEWDDTVAAGKYREHQARHIINSIEVISTEVKAEPVRAFFKIQEGTASYSPTEMIVKTEIGREHLLQMALREFRALEHKYQTLEEFCGVFAALDQVSKEVLKEDIA